MRTVLFLNSSNRPCGVQLWAERVGELLSTSTKYNVVYSEVNDSFEYWNLTHKYRPDIILYNYHIDTMAWLKRFTLYANAKHIAVVHEGFSHRTDHVGFDKYIYLPENTIIDSGWEDRIFVIKRSLLEYNGEYKVNPVVTIGTSGYGFKHKQLPLIVRKVNEEFDNAIIRFNIPNHFKADVNGLLAKEEEHLCRNEITKPGIQLIVTNDYLSEDKLLEFLAGNDVNAYFYDSSKLDSSSAGTDHALSVNRPIAITKSPMFSHIISRIGTAICIEEHTFSEIIRNGTDVLKPLKEEWSKEALLKQFEDIFDGV